MQFEKIRTINKRKMIVGGLISLSVISALIYLPSKAKYRTTESFNIVNGEINYKVPDFKMIAMYSSEDGSNYTEIEKTPGKNYKINEVKSYCTLNNTDKDTEAKLYTDKYGQHVFNNITKSEKCYVWFDKNTEIVSTALGSLEVNKYIPDFSQAATTDEGIFKAEDNDGVSYYWRGAATTNYVKFAGYCWRIIRINGDGTIRLIYDGSSCHQNGEAITDSIVGKTSYNLYNRSEYVGYIYEEGRQRPEDNTTGTVSILKEQIDTWYKDNISNKGFEEKIAEGKYCNDRSTTTRNSWDTQPIKTFYYAGNDRIAINHLPTFTCYDEDVYILKTGYITADEASFAGGIFGSTNNWYFLYNNQYYWTMTPYDWDANLGDARAFYFAENGAIGDHSLYINCGIRPVINLKVDTVFSSGDGTLNSPYIVQ